MAKKFDIPYSLYKRGEIWHAYFSFQTDDGRRVQFRKSTQRNDYAKADRWAYDKYKEMQLNLPKKGELAQITLDTAFGIYWQEHCKFQSSPTQAMSRLATLKKDLGVKYLHEIDEHVLKSFIARRRKVPGVKYPKKSYEWANQTINHHLILLSGCVKYLKGKYKTTDFHILSLRLPVKAENVKYFKDEEIIEKIIERIAEHARPVVYTCLYTGMRMGNATSLKWSSIDFENNLITIWVKDKHTEGGKLHTIPMIKKLRDILISQPKINEYVFNYKGKPFKRWYTAWRNVFYERDKSKRSKCFLKDSNGEYVLKDPNLPYADPYTLRHTAATWILKATGNLRVVQKILGHSTVRMTEKYAHILKCQEKDALETTFK